MADASLSLGSRTATGANCLPFRRRQALRLTLLKSRLKEYLTFDCALFKLAVGFVAYVAALGLGVWRPRRAFLLLSKLHRADWLGVANARAERLAREAAAQASTGGCHPILSFFEDHIERNAPILHALKFMESDPCRVFGGLAMVLKSPAAGDKGVLLLQYSGIFPLFARFFDVQRLASRYYLVLEPAWSGYCDANVVSYCRFPFPVFVQAYEPRDAEFVARTRSNLVVVPTSANGWVDHRLFRPLPGIAKDVDVVMVAGWAEYKRHWRFFHALARLKRAGHRLRVLLLGYPLSFAKETVLNQAAYYGVADQLEVHQSVPYPKVNEFLNRAHVSILWSRREGVNRAIIEGMFAGLPCIVREGLNYGYPYPYINPQTGCFASERDLPAKLLSIIGNAHRLSPREWVLANMSCQRSTAVLSEYIGKTAVSRGEPWKGGLAVKVNKLDAMEYWNPQDYHGFEEDYRFLRSTLRKPT